MGVNTGIVTGLVGILRIVTVIVGVITLGLAADGYNRIPKEEFFLAMVIILFVASVIWIILFLVEILQSTEITKKLDMGVHIIGGLLLLISAIVWIVSVIELENAICSRFHCTKFNQSQRLVAGIFGLGNGVLYLVIGAILAKAKA